jgi:hypothetical protein
MTEEEKKIEVEKISRGLEIAFERLIEEKKRTNSELVISRNGKIMKIKPEEMEKELGIKN